MAMTDCCLAAHRLRRFLEGSFKRIHARWVDGHASNLIVKTPVSAVVLPGDRIALYFTPDAMILLTS
jgi:hypothetical protein